MSSSDSSPSAGKPPTGQNGAVSATTSNSNSEFTPWRGDVPASFSHLPWAVELLKDPSWITFTTHSRNPAHQRRRTFFNYALANPSMVGACLMQRHNPDQHPIPPSQLSDNPYVPRTIISETRIFLLLGPLAQGHRDVSHGGLVATLLDEAQGSVVFAGMDYLNEHHPRPDSLPDRRIVTLTLEVSYRRAVPAPGAVLARAWMEKVEGRKLFTRAVLEDGVGNVLVKGRGLFLESLENVGTKL